MEFQTESESDGVGKNPNAYLEAFIMEYLYVVLKASLKEFLVGFSKKLLKLFPKEFLKEFRNKSEIMKKFLKVF